MAGGIIQQSTSNLGSFWSILMTFLAQVVEEPTGKGDFLDLIQTRKN